jgi:hypothetical protein
MQMKLFGKRSAVSITALLALVLYSFSALAG